MEHVKPPALPSLCITAYAGWASGDAKSYCCSASIRQQVGKGLPGLRNALWAKVPAFHCDTCGILSTVATDRQTIGNRRAALFFGAVLCVLLAFFAVERRIAAYPAHNLAAAITAATGVQKPEQIAFTEPRSLHAPVLFVCALAVFAAFPARFIAYLAEPAGEAEFLYWAPTPLAVRPPPAL